MSGSNDCPDKTSDEYRSEQTAMSREVASRVDQGASQDKAVEAANHEQAEADRQYDGYTRSTWGQ